MCIQWLNVLVHGSLGSDLRIQLFDLVTLLQSSGVGSQLKREQMRSGHHWREARKTYSTLSEFIHTLIGTGTADFEHIQKSLFIGRHTTDLRDDTTNKSSALGKSLEELI